MRIALVTETFFPATDGICTRLGQMVRIMKQLGHEILIVSPDLGVDNYDGVPITKIESVTVPFYPSRPWALPSRKIREVLLQFNPDIVHAVNPFLMVTSAVHYAKKLQIPLLTSYHTHISQYLDYYNLPLLKPAVWEYIKLWHTGSDINLTVSTSLQVELREQGIPVDGTMPSGVDLSMRSPKYFDEALYQKLTFGLKDQKLLVYVGRLAAEKSLDQLREIFNYRDDVCLSIVGDGPERENLEKLFARTKTTFNGFKQGEELATYFATGDAFIFPSTSETFGLVISEAMASGLPVIAASSGPTLEQIEDNVSGLVYEPGNIQSLLEKINVLDLPLQVRRIKVTALRVAEEKTWLKASHLLLDSYRQAIELSDVKYGRMQKLSN